MRTPYFVVLSVIALAVLAIWSSDSQARQNPVEPIATPLGEVNHTRLDAVLRAIAESLDHIPGEVIVKFHEGTPSAVQNRVFSLAPAASNTQAVYWVGDVAVLTIDDRAPAAQVAARLALEPEVEYAHPNYFSRLQATPNDPGLSRQWNFNAIQLPAAWDINPGGRDVLVAVVDSGVTDTNTVVNYRLWTGREFANVAIPYRVNPDLTESRMLRGVDTTTFRLSIPGFASETPVFDTDGHGTHVASTILQSTNNNFGFTGVAYEARLLPVKSCFSYWDLQFFLGAVGEPGFVPVDFDGGCITSDVIAGIRQAADQGARVINLSLGGPSEAPAYRDALTYAVSRGAFIAIAMGNEFEDGNPVEYPAVYAASFDGVMSVTAVNRSLGRAYYSSTGAHAEIAAPGGDIRDGGTTGLIYQIAPFAGDFSPATVVVPRFDRFSEVGNQGTSMAAPHVAGVAALLYSQGVTNPAAIEAAIKQFARDLGSAGRDSDFGHGLVDARAALRGLGLAR